MGKMISYMMIGATAAVAYKVIEDNKMSFNMKKVSRLSRRKMKWLKNMM